MDAQVESILATLALQKTRSDVNAWREGFFNLPALLEKVGLHGDELTKLKVIHVAGTKGKGSTCAMVEAMLRQSGYKTGLFTSPHLVDVRERMRINGAMVSKEVFEQQFWDCYGKLKGSAPTAEHVPGYFTFMTLLALKVFLTQSLDVVVLEVGVGGRLDATNVVPAPVVCGITALGFDHMELLGDTLPKIAREKAGIFKPGRPAFTVQQPQDAMEALQEVASVVGVPLQTVGLLDTWKPADGSAAAHMSLGGAHQLQNAGLAVQLCQTYEQERLDQGAAKPGADERLTALKQGILPVEYMQGLANTSWPGRCQVVQDVEFLPSASQDTVPAARACSTASQTSRLSFFIDGAHTPESLAACAEWFGRACIEQPPPSSTSHTQRVLLFNCMKDRDPAVLLPALSGSLAAAGIRLDHALFAPLDWQIGIPAASQQPGSKPAAESGAAKQPDYSWQVQLSTVWQTQCRAAHNCGAEALSSAHLPTIPGLPLQASQTGAVAPSLGSAVDWLRGVVRARPHLRLQVLVTGSLYLVGDVLKLLGQAPK